MPGIPLLLGGWQNLEAIDGKPSKVHFSVVRDVGGQPFGHGVGATAHTQSAYEAVARAQPRALALAIMRCFHSLSERGGYVTTDMTPRQFTFAVEPSFKTLPREYRRSDGPFVHGPVVVELVDGPGSAIGPPAQLFSRPPAPLGLAGYPTAPVRSCTRDADCPSMKGYYCCCLNRRNAVRSGTPAPGQEPCPHGDLSGALEARGACAVGGPPDAARWQRLAAPALAAPLPRAAGRLLSDINISSSHQHSSSHHSSSPSLHHSHHSSSASATSRGPHCMPLTDMTHVHDAATKPWLLPLAAKYDAGVARYRYAARTCASPRVQESEVTSARHYPPRRLLPRMALVPPEERLTFSAAIKLLGGGNGSESFTRPFSFVAPPRPSPTRAPPGPATMLPHACRNAVPHASVYTHMQPQHAAQPHTI
jgi:hypothetical protein